MAYADLVACIEYMWTKQLAIINNYVTAIYIILQKFSELKNGDIGIVIKVQRQDSIHMYAHSSKTEQAFEITMTVALAISLHNHGVR